MRNYEPPSDYQPVTWWRGHPVYCASLLVAIHSAAMLLFVLAGAAGQPELFGLFSFSNSTFLHGLIWQPLTYALVNGPSLWFVFDMYMLWVFGRELERFLGLKAFLRLYLILIALLPILYLALYSWRDRTGLAGCSAVCFAIFVAFATLYPDALMLFGITAKWMAVIFVGIGALQSLQAQDVRSLLFLAVEVGAAWAYVRWARGQLSLPRFPSWHRLFQKKPRLYVVKASPPPPRPASREDSPSDTIDSLLDKIARSGLNSLTPAERAQLEKASAKMKERDGM